MGTVYLTRLWHTRWHEHHHTQLPTPSFDILVQRRRNKQAAERFFRRWLMTDKLKSHDAAHRTMMPSVQHINIPYANNRVEVSHQPTRQQKYHMRGFASSTQAQRFLMLHGLTQNLFRLGRHFMQAVNYRLLRIQAFPSLEGSRLCLRGGAIAQRVRPILFAAH